MYGRALQITVLGAEVCSWLGVMRGLFGSNHIVFAVLRTSGMGVGCYGG